MASHAPHSTAYATALLAIGLVAGTLPVHGHGKDLVLIEAFSDAIAKTADPDLLIRRGELYRHHQDWMRADQGRR